MLQVRGSVKTSLKNLEKKSRQKAITSSREAESHTEDGKESKIKKLLGEKGEKA